MKLKQIIQASVAALAISAAAVTPAKATVDPFIGQIITVAYDWCPQGYMAANGQVLAINTNTALFSLLGATYGGNGTTTFALPDLRGRAIIHQGAGAGLPVTTIGALTGSGAVSIQTTNLPPHVHTLQAASNTAVAQVYKKEDIDQAFTDNGLTTPTGAAAEVSVSAPTFAQSGVTGSGLPLATQSPRLTLNYCIATQGVYPTRP
jgi:microcystin-dependent protein